MRKYSVDAEIEAESLGDAQQKVKSLEALGKKLTTKELARLEHIVLYEPSKTALAKKYLGLA